MAMSLFLEVHRRHGAGSLQNTKGMFGWRLRTIARGSRLTDAAAMLPGDVRALRGDKGRSVGADTFDKVAILVFERLRSACKSCVVCLLTSLFQARSALLHGDESGLTGLWADDCFEVVGVPACGFSGGFDGSFAFSGAHHVEGEASDEGHVGGAVAAAQARLTFLKDDVEHPVKALDAPMAADCRGGALRGEGGGGDEVAAFLRYGTDGLNAAFTLNKLDSHHAS